MKHILLPLLGAALALPLNAQTLFSTSFNSQEEFDSWTVIDANNDGKTWIYSETNDSGNRTYYTYSGENAADDWLISPAITPTTSGNYLVSYAFTGSSYGESLKMFYGSEPTIEALSKNEAASFPLVTDSQQTAYFFVEGKAGEPIYFAFYACSGADKFRLYAQHFEVKQCDNPVDLAVTEITSPVSGEDLGTAETIKLKIANYGLSDAAGPYTVSVNLDGEDVFTETLNQTVPHDGEIEVALSTPIDLSVSHRNYKLRVTVSHPDDISASNNVLSAVVRHVGPAVEPYFMGFESDEDTSDIQYINLNDDSGYWSTQVNGWWVSPSRTGVRCMCYNYSKENQADDWAILDGIQMKAGYHVLKFWVSTMDDSHTEAFGVYWGNEADPAALTNKIAVYDPITQAAYAQKICIFELDKDQTVYIGFHATSPANQNWIAIDDIEVNSISADAVELAATSITYPLAGAYVPEKSSHDFTYTIMNQGVKDAQGTITVKIDGETKVEKTVNLVAQEDKSFTDANILEGLSTGKHTIEVSVYNASEENIENNVASIEFTSVGTPDFGWDFEDALVPSAFTIREEDGYTLSSYAIDEFGETGVGIMNISEHQYYGKYMLGISNWFTTTGYADRWVVLPKMHVDSEDALVYLNAGSASASIKENYRLKVSKGEDKWWDYDTALSVNNADYVRKNVGASLAEYVGEDVYVAINVTTYDGDCLSVDNIGVVGCSIIDSGVKAVTIKDADFGFDGETLTFGNFDSVNINVYSVSGQLVYRATGKTFSLANLAHGVYVLKASTPSGVVTTKIVK